MSASARRSLTLLTAALLAMSLLVTIGAATAAAEDPVTSLYFNSEPGDYIGQGLEQTWTPADGTFTASFDGDHVHVFFDAIASSGTWWHLDFDAPDGSTLSVGPYENATRYPFNPPTENGLSVSGSGRGCNTLTGRFDVLEVSIAGDGTVERFAADFQQHCEGGEPALFGTVQFNAQGDDDPTVTADLNPVGRIKPTSGKFAVGYTCSDDVDPSPVVTAFLNGVEVTNGQVVKLKVSERVKVREGRRGLTIQGPSFELVVTCTDAAGNVGSATAVPVFG